MESENCSPAEIANFALSKLTGTLINSAQNPDIVEEQVSNSIQAALEKFKKPNITNAVSMTKAVFGGIWNMFKGKSLVADVKANYIQRIFTDKQFLAAFSTLIPFEQYQTLLKKLQTNPEISKKMTENVLVLGNNPEPKDLVSVIAAGAELTLDFVPAQAEQAREDINNLLAKKDSNPSSLLKTAIIEQVSKPTQKTLIPLIAKFLKDEKDRDGFIEHCKGIPDAQLFDFMVTHQELIDALDNDNFEIMKYPLVQFLNKLNELSNSESKLPTINIDDLQSLTAYVDNQLNSIEDMTQIAAISEYLRSTQFIEVLMLIYNDTDLKQIAEVLVDDEKRGQLALKIKLSDGSLDHIDDLFTEYLPQIKSLDRRLNDCADFFDNLSPEDSPLQNLNKTKLNALIQEKLLDKLNHPLIIEQFSVVLSIFNEDELKNLLEIPSLCEYSSITARKLLNFYHFLKTGDIKAIANEFLLQEYDNFDQLPLIQLVEVIGNIYQEIIKCHCYFNQHGMRGEVVDDKNIDIPHVNLNKITPKIYNLLSGKIRQIKTDIEQHTDEKNGTNMENLSRVTLYLRGLQKSFPEANRLHRYNHAEEIRHLKRVRDHVLEPIRVRIGRSIVSNWIADRYDAFKRGIKWVFSSIGNVFRSSTLTQQQQLAKLHEQELKQDNADAKKFSSAIKSLKGLTREEARMKQGVHEAVDKLEIKNIEPPALFSEKSVIEQMLKAEKEIFNVRFFKEAMKGMPLQTATAKLEVRPGS